MGNKFGTKAVREVAGVGRVLLVFAAAATAGEVASAVDTKIWGRAVFNAHDDTAIQARDFMSYLTDDPTEEVNFTPRDTRFGFAEAANGRGLSIRGGQDWVPVAQQNPWALDFGIQSWSGNLWWRVPQVTVRCKPQKTEFPFSAMKHRISNDQEMQEKMPWLLGSVASSDVLGAGSLVVFGGGFRSAEVDSVDYAAYLAALELKLPLGNKVTLTGEDYLGEGVGREFVHYGFDCNPDHPDGAREIRSQCGFLSLMYAAPPKIELSAGYGLDDPRDEDLADSAAPYLKNSSFIANLKYKVTPQFGRGLEVIHLVTAVGAADDLSGQRFTGSWWYIFWRRAGIAGAGRRP